MYMSRVLPILFNTEMVRAILDGRKTVTRRVIKYKYSNTEMKMRTDKYGTRLVEIQKDVEGETYGKNPDGSTWHKLLGYIEPKPPYQPGDILYVRETWCNANIEGVEPDYYYYADVHICEDYNRTEWKWRPSIHMPKEAARIWLKVTAVRVERLQEITVNGCVNKGAYWLPKNPEIIIRDSVKRAAIKKFSELWNSTIKKSDLDRYGWGCNPWVWAIEFEQCEKPERGL